MPLRAWALIVASISTWCSASAQSTPEQLATKADVPNWRAPQELSAQKVTSGVVGRIFRVTGHSSTISAPITIDLEEGERFSRTSQDVHIRIIPDVDGARIVLRARADQGLGIANSEPTWTVSAKKGVPQRVTLHLTAEDIGPKRLVLSATIVTDAAEQTATEVFLLQAPGVDARSPALSGARFVKGPDGRTTQEVPVRSK